MDSTEPRILLITDRIPHQDSGYGIRVSNVVTGLAEVGSLTICLIDSSIAGADLDVDDDILTLTVRARDLPRWRRAVRTLWTFPNTGYRHRPEVVEQVKSAVGSEPFDVVWFSRARVRQLCGEMFEGVQIVDLDDLNDRLELSLAVDRRHQFGAIRTLPRNIIAWLLARRWRQYHAELADDVDQLVVCSEADQNHLDVANCAIVPNGYPEPATPRLPASGSPQRMIFVGPLTYEPNYLAVHWLVHEILDKVRAEVPGVELIVVGEHDGNLRELAHPATTFLGFVDDLTMPYHQATIAVAPVHSGGGTRLKVIEAMARDTPMVSAPFACAGLGLQSDRELIIANTTREFVTACVSLLSDPERAARLTAAAAQTYADHLSATASSRAVADVVKACMNSPVRHRATTTDHGLERN